MSKTSIEWTDYSLNPLRARGPNGKSGHHCVKVGPGCKNCYSSRFQPRLGLPLFQEQRSDPPTLFLDAKTLLEPLKRRKPTKFFWCDMTDMFGEWVPFEWIAACFAVMAATPRHTHQVLTKRPERAREFFAWVNERSDQYGSDLASIEHVLAASYAYETGDGSDSDHDDRLDDMLERIRDGYRPDNSDLPWPLPNVWLGVSVEDQQRADERIPLLLKTPASVRFLSCEPLLGPVELRDEDWTTKDYLRGTEHLQGSSKALPGKIDWVIVGGESGPGARPTNLDWIRSIVEQCRAANVPCFVKQAGARPVDDGVRIRLADRKGGDLEELPADLRIREFPRAT